MGIEREHLPGRRLLLGGIGVVGASGLLAAGLRHGASRTTALPVAEIPLSSRTVALDADSRRVLIAPGPEGDGLLLPGTRLLAGTPEDSPPAMRAAAFHAEAAPWLGRVPDALQDLAESALWDLWSLCDGLAAPVAGWSSNWRYVWPRDAAFCAVALARTGHVAPALDALEHLQSWQRPRTWFEARYSLATGRAPDARPQQVDGTGLVLWAVAEVLSVLTGDASETARERLSALIEDSSALLIEATGAGTHLPPVSPDYWEVAERSVTLETMIATLAGLRAVADLSDEDACREPAEAFALLADGTFGEGGWQRYRSGGGADSARALPDALGIAGLVPAADLLALRTELARPAGGIAPGASWKDDGISWTPSTSLLALSLARAGHRTESQDLLGWLADHRTQAGSLPEKVLHDGSPAAVAPLSWTAANVLLAIDALS